MEICTPTFCCIVVYGKPLVHPVVEPQANYINEQLSSAITPPAEREKLNESFKTFFNELDDKTESALPEAPAAEPEAAKEPEEQPSAEHSEQPAPAAETPVSETPKRRRRSPKDPIPEITEEEEPVGDELDSLSPHPQSSQATKSQFGQLKTIARNFREEAKALRSFVQDLGYDLPSNREELTSRSWRNLTGTHVEIAVWNPARNARS